MSKKTGEVQENNFGFLLDYELLTVWPKYGIEWLA
jgi:hypothetical protein